MKTAISIPDKLFRRADKLAKKLGMTRSRLYADAIERYVAEQNPSTITKRLNEIYGPNGEGSELDLVLAELQWRTIREAAKDETW